MPPITRDSLMTLEAYARTRQEFRARVMAHKKNRTLHLGEHVTLIFEDELTVRYQIQEMLRVERVFEEAGIQDELDAYNPLVPDGSNWKATMMIEYADPRERSRMLAWRSTSSAKATCSGKSSTARRRWARRNWNRPGSACST